MQQAWDRASKLYLERRGREVRSVQYGNLAPDDDALGLLGELRGAKVLDFGCGGGQNSVACALAGADVVGVDISVAQLSAAADLAIQHGVNIKWRHGNGEKLAQLPGIPFDLVLAIQVLPYVENTAVLLRNLRGVVAAGGRLIMSVDHPLRNCFYDAEMEELSAYPLRDYFDCALLRWRFAEDVPMEAQHRPLGEWIALVVAAGFVLEQVIEAAAPGEICDELWPEDSPLAPLRNIPHTVIVVARAP